jgi:hypothetical protein
MPSSKSRFQVPSFVISFNLSLLTKGLMSMTLMSGQESCFYSDRPSFGSWPDQHTLL